MADMHASLVQAEVRRANDKAVWCEARGEPQRALLYRAYARRLQGYPPATAQRVAEDALEPHDG